MLSYAFDNEPEQLIAGTGHDDFELPFFIREAVLDPNVRKIAFNAFFEIEIFKHVLGVDTQVEQWQCAMVRGLSLSLPGNLLDLTRVLGLPENQQKNKSGKALIKKFCVPREPTKAKPHTRCTALTDPEEWQRLCDYCKQDTGSERRAWKRMAPFYVPPIEWERWHRDYHMNSRGMPIDLDFVEAAIRVAALEKERVIQQMREITGLRNPVSGAQLVPWLRERGYPFTNLPKARVAKALEDFTHVDQRPPHPEMPEALREALDDELEMRVVVRSEEQQQHFDTLLVAYEKALSRHRDWRLLEPDAIAVLKLLQKANRRSTDKFVAMLNKHVGGYLYFEFQFMGAGRTGRAAGRNVQLHNMARPHHKLSKHLAHIRELILQEDTELLRLLYDDIMSCLSSSVRSAIKAPDGSWFIVCDLSSIESRVIGWIARCETILEVFRSGKDIYKAFAVYLFNKPYEEISKDERQDTKPAALGCGYRLGGGQEVGEYPDTLKTGLWAYAENMGIRLKKEACHHAVRVYREVYHEVVQFWYDIEAAVRHVIHTHESRKVGYIIFDYKKPFLRMRLPSGRFIYYLRPRVEQIKKIWDDGEVTYVWNITYEGYNTKKKWVRLETHGGKFTEQICQGIARDILYAGIDEAERVGFNLLGHVHDEQITMHRKDSVLTLHDLEQAMVVHEDWMGALPLGAEGYCEPVYKKG